MNTLLALLTLLPLVAAVGLCVALLAPLVDRRADLVVTRLALALFGEYVTSERARGDRERELLRAAHTGDTHRRYASRTLLYAAALGVAGSVVGVYAAAALLGLLSVGEGPIAAALPGPLVFLAALARLTEVGLGELFVLLVASSATVGAGLAVGTYYVRWELLAQRAVARASRIDTTLPRTVAFVYALSRSGMAFPNVMDTLAEHEAVYGEAATELAVAVRDMNAFGTDALTALRGTAKRTPSEDLAEFSENLASVLSSGQSLSGFLEDQYERYQEEAEARQEQYLELLSTFAETYVTALVAGPLFFITLLVVIGLVLENTLPLVRVIVYVALPLATFGFVVYVDSVTHGVGGTEPLPPRERGAPDEGASPSGDGTSLPDGGVSSSGGAITEDRWARSRERLAAHERLRGVLAWASSPVEHVLERPATVLFVSVPIALVGVALVAFPITVGPPTRMVGQVDAAIVTAVAGVLASYAVVYEIRKRRTRRIEASVPDFLDRLASVNEAGASVVESVRRVSESDLDALTAELVRTRRDVEWGADVTTALHRMDRRVRSPVLSRAVALVTNALHASGDIAPVLKIAADETRATERLRRERRQVMLTYLIVIYISFLVFLGIIAALSIAFIPAIESAATGGAGGGVPGGGGGITDGIGDIDVFVYEQVFFHAAAVQAICSGLVAGQLGEGSVRDGAKHAVILLALTAVAFALMGSL